MTKLGNDIHIWSIQTLSDPATLYPFRQILSPGEIQRAGRLKFEHLALSFIASHAALRILLGRYANIPPAEIAFSYNPQGKPSLQQSPALCFNASHSVGLAIFAFAHNCEIGIDIEQIRPIPGMQNIAENYFHPAEAADLISLPDALREPAFFHCWTRKEAYIKATGQGLSLPLNTFRVTLQPDQDPRFLAPDDLAATWTLQNLAIAPGYAAAVAYPGASKTTKTMQSLGLTTLDNDTTMQSFYPD